MVKVKLCISKKGQKGIKLIVQGSHYPYLGIGCLAEWQWNVKCVWWIQFIV